MQHCTLAIDIGNTHTKLCLLVDDKPHKTMVYNVLDHDEIVSIYSERHIDHTIISSVDDDKYRRLSHLLQQADIPFTTLTHHTPLPFDNLYTTPHTLGLDRIAALVGAQVLHPATPVLIIDAGTCITYDLLVDKQFVGGNISPGIDMRLQAMHHFTAALPQVEFHTVDNAMGTDTHQAILNGAFWGVVNEIFSYIQRFTIDYPHLTTIITGGSADYIKEYLPCSSSIDYQPYLVPIGLNYIANQQSK